jgi:transposase-like protein
MVNLPPSNTNRWVARRKAAVLAALRSGAITMEEVCRRYALSEEELLAWQRAFETHGLSGLRATRLRGRRTRRSKAADPRL